MRLLLVGSERFEARPGGLNRYVDDIAPALRAAGVDLEVQYPGEREFGPAKGPALTLLRFAGSVVDGLRGTRRADLVDIHFAWYGLGALAGAKLRKLPVVVHFHGPWAGESVATGRGGSLAHRAKFAVERLLFRRTDRFIVLSEAFAELLSSTYGVARDRIAVVAPGLDHRRFDGSGATRAAVPTAVTARRLERRMGLDVVVDAWPAVLATHPDARLLIIGDGPERGPLAEAARTRGVAGHVALLGRVSDDDLARLYSEAHVSVVPSRALEGFGLVVLESLASGTPPVVTRVGGLPEHVSLLDPTLVVEPEDPAALAARLVAAFDGDRPTPEQCVAFAGTYTWTATAREHLLLFDALGVPTGIAAAASPTAVPAGRP